MRRHILIGLCLAWMPLAALAQDYNLNPQSIGLIAPGTIITDGVPRGWTHLIVKSHPRAASGDLDKVPDRDKQLASLLSTALVARVEQTAGGTFAIAEVATGAATTIGGRDTVINMATQQQLGANLGFFAKMVLKEFDSKQSEVVYRIRNPHFTVVDTIGAFRWNNQNRLLPLRYAMIIDPQSGQLDTFCCLMDTDASGRVTTTAGKLQWLPPSLVFSPQLYVDYGQYNFVGIPSDTAFCSTNIPPGQVTMNIPPDAGRVLAKQDLTAGEAASLHGWFAQITVAMRQQYAGAVQQR